MRLCCSRRCTEKIERYSRQSNKYYQSAVKVEVGVGLADDLRNVFGRSDEERCTGVGDCGQFAVVLVGTDGKAFKTELPKQR